MSEDIRTYKLPKISAEAKLKTISYETLLLALKSVSAENKLCYFALLRKIEIYLLIVDLKIQASKLVIRSFIRCFIFLELRFSFYTYLKRPGFWLGIFLKLLF